MRIDYYLGDLKNHIKWAYQRAFRGYDDTAHWGLCDCIMEIVIPVLERELKIEGVSGYPHYLLQFYPELSFKELEKKWFEIRKKIVGGFKMNLEVDEFELNDKDRAEYYKKTQEASKLFGKYFYNLWM